MTPKKWTKERFEIEAPKQYKELEKAWADLIRAAAGSVFDLHQSVLLLRGFNRVSPRPEIPARSADFTNLFQKINADLPGVLPGHEIQLLENFFSLAAGPVFDDAVLSDLLNLLSALGCQKVTLPDLNRLDPAEMLKSPDYLPFIAIYLSLFIDFKRAFSRSWVYAGLHGMQQAPVNYFEFFERYIAETNQIFKTSALVAAYGRAIALCTGFIRAKIPEKISASRNSRAKTSEKDKKAVEFLKKYPEYLDPDKKLTSGHKRDLLSILGLVTVKHAEGYLETARKILKTRP